jgi:serine/threonine protein kinase
VDEVVFGRYRLLSLIGEGGMGKVYKAHDTMMDRDVAIKVLLPELATEPGYEQRFRREAYAAARLTEPHIIPVHEAGEIDGRLYLVMPIIEGIDAHTLLQRDGPMSPPRAVHVIEQLAAALDAAHAVGLVHRDIKPSNALVTARDFVYLIDFGIAHDAAATRLTSTGIIVGTLAYMAPERFTAGIADARSDVYALACVLHECLTGHRPYPGESMEQQIAGHLTLYPPRPSEHRPNIPVGFDEVIARGMAKEPDQRYQSAHELSTAAHQAMTTAPSHNPNTLAAPTLADDQAPLTPSPALAWQQPAYPTLAATQQHPPGEPPVRQPQSADRPSRQIVTSPPPLGRRRRRWLGWPLIAVTVFILATAGITGYLLRPHSRASSTGSSAATSPSTSAVTSPSRALPTDYSPLLIKPSDIGGDLNAPQPPVLNPNGAPGVAQLFATADNSRRIGDTILIVADPATAAAGVENTKTN